MAFAPDEATGNDDDSDEYKLFLRDDLILACTDIHRLTLLGLDSVDSEMRCG